jgi:hypothetical protein
VVPIVVSGAVTTNKATISSIQTFMQGNLDLGVTSVGITFGTSGTDINASGSPVTSSGNITINLPTASATNRGALSSADWITFNAKQPAGNYVTLDTVQTITAQKTFTTSGSSDTMIISHGSGSGFALDVIKAGSGEAIRVQKSSGSGNAMSITGGNFSAEAATFSGVVTTTPDAVINGVNVGKGGGSVVNNTRVGSACLSSNTTGSSNTSVGFGSLQNNTTGSLNTSVGINSLKDNTEGDANTSLGSNALNKNTTGDNNTANGSSALFSNTTGSNNSAFGHSTLNATTTGGNNSAFGLAALQNNTTGGNNTAVGFAAGSVTNGGLNNSTSSSSVYIGHDTRAGASGNSNEIVIGEGGRGNGSNTVVIGNASITDNYFTGNIRGGAFIKSSGTSSQFLKADGSVDSSTYLTTGSASSTYLPLAGGTLTGALNGTSAAFTGNLQVGGSAISGNSSSFFNTAAETSVGIKQTSGATILALSLWNNSTTGDSRFLRFFTEASATYRGAIQYDRAGDRLGIYGGGSGLFFDGAATFSSSVTARQGTINGLGGSRYQMLTLTGAGASDEGLFITTTGTGNDFYAIKVATGANANAFALTNAGNVGIGTASPANILEISTTSKAVGDRTGVNLTTTNSSAADLGLPLVWSANGTISNYATASIAGRRESATAGNYSGYLQLSTTDSAGSLTERMRITSGGIVDMAGVLVVRGTLPADQTDAAVIDHFSNSMRIFSYGAAGVTGDFAFKTAAGGASSNTVATINGSTGIYTPTSDINKKKDFEESTIGLNEILGLKPTLYRMINDESEGEKELGFIAQEVKEFIPHAYVESGEDEENKFIGLNYNPIVAALVKAIQEQQEQIDSLKNQIK